MIKKAIITFVIATLLWVLFICCIVSKAHAQEKDTIKKEQKSTQKQTSKDFKIQEKNFAMCVKSGESRSICQYLYR